MNNVYEVVVYVVKNVILFCMQLAEDRDTPYANENGAASAGNNRFSDNVDDDGDHEDDIEYDNDVAASDDQEDELVADSGALRQRKAAATKADLS